MGAGRSGRSLRDEGGLVAGKGGGPVTGGLGVSETQGAGESRVGGVLVRVGGGSGEIWRGCNCT